MIGLIVNPVAGVGGPAGLAGSDGADVQRLAVSRGARSRVQERAAAALSVLAAQHPGLVIATAAGAMGADAVRAAGLLPHVVDGVSGAPGARVRAERTATSRADAVHSAASGALAEGAAGTAGADTSRAVTAVVAAGADLVLVVGGDGTLRDAAAGLGVGASAFTTPPESVPSATAGAAGGASAQFLRSCEQQPAVLGVPAGVKMYSPVFAVSPAAAGAIAADWVSRGPLPTEDREVLDIDEAALRHARVEPTLYALLRVPVRTGRTQARKAPTPASEAAAVEAAARGAIALMRPGVRYLLGPGGTAAAIARQLGVEGTPLGVDVVLDGAVVSRGASEQQLLAEISRGRAQAVVTVIGGQGFLLGRGNQQLSASVLRAIGDDPLLVVAPEQKLIDLRGRPLLVDTGDLDLDARLAGHVRVITGVGTRSLYPVTAPELTPTQ
ncbi:NAD(+)/NADH kinase [Microbacterium sp. SSW1-49]|uniref:NAD(+)/NADH kinase n=1 Tax=Microbacterium croceum TaxID=2851645 RepID=A0ABT0FCA3_9MICO|nr:NAD(+)/NADH kinase [Microbacterium croceum]MCK2035342.1 NAD(+)/NADH kinase [Microbacterium croceum]